MSAFVYRMASHPVHVQLEISGSVAAEHAPLLGRYSALKSVSIWLTHALPLGHLMRLTRIHTLKFRVDRDPQVLLSAIERMGKGGDELV